MSGWVSEGEREGWRTERGGEGNEKRERVCEGGREGGR